MDLNELQLKGLGTSLQRRDGQISHGLNLVLKLKDPLRMPLLLAEIEQAKRKIDAGLGELNFVHFARFLPTYDNTALQVITEFDGPLAPYVLDFAIEIGGVFNTLLSYTEGTEHLVPIAENPAAFLAFVEEHNTVTVLPGIPELRFPDWPVYSAYPEQTVLDITGPRNDLPIPKADRWATPVAAADVQANILRGYRAERVRHFLLRVVDAPKARAWLADRATADDSNGGAKPEWVLNIGLTYVGMVALGIRKAWRTPFPEAFRQGALERAADNFDTGPNAPAHWWLGGPQQQADIHVIVSLYHSEADFDVKAQALAASLPAGGLQVVAKHDAVHRDGVSWFGYADGIANPRIAVACPVPKEQQDLQPASTAGEFVLGADYKNIYGGPSLGALPEALATNGSFCAIRVLQQDTKAFDETVKAEAARLTVEPDWLAAKLMGRWYKGAPLSLHPATEPVDPDEGKRNDFDYAPSYEYPGTPMDHIGERCPVGAHIRRGNPRTARVAGARYARRVMRRGMHYEIKDAQGQREEVGLFGMFICADLERQFEFIQRQWINGDRFAAGLRGTRDPIIGTPLGEDDVFSIPMPKGSLEVRLPQFVFTKGSLYMFMPGLDALRHLERFATEDPPSPVAKAHPPETESLEDVVRGVLAELKKSALSAFRALNASDLLEIAQASVGTFGKAQNRIGSLGNLRFDPRRRDFQINPYPVYAWFRANEPVHYSPLYDGWFIFGYDNVMRVCTEDDKFSAAELGSTSPRGLFTLDDPEHAALRSIVEPAWMQAAANTPMFVQRSIKRTLDAIGARQCFDLVDDFARPVPRDVYFDILGANGIGANDRLELDALARTVLKAHDHTFTDLQRWDGLLAALKLSGRLVAMSAKSLVSGSYQGSFLTSVAQAVFLGRVRPVVALATLVILTCAGFMSAEFLLATSIRRLLLDKAAGWDKVSDPAWLTLFLQEMRRTEHALSVIDRFAKKDIDDMGPVRIPKGERVFAVLASANRDRVFEPDADTFNPYRYSSLPLPPPHLAFGWGAHECMGRSLEGSITGPAIRELVARMPGLRLQSTAQPPWFEDFYFRSFDHLAVTLK